MENTLIRLFGQNNLESSIYELPKLRENNPFKSISDGVIEDGADLLYFRVRKHHELTDRNLYYEWIKSISGKVRVDYSKPYFSCDEFWEQIVRMHIECNDLRKTIPIDEQHLPLLANPNALVRPVAQRYLAQSEHGTLANIIKKITNAERHPFTARVSINAMRRKDGTLDQLEPVDFRYADKRLPFKVKWHFDFAVVVPMEYSWIGHMLCKNYELGDVGLYCDTPKIPSATLQYETLVSAWNELFGHKKYNLRLQFSAIPKDVLTAAETISRRLGIMCEMHEHDERPKVSEADYQAYCSGRWASIKNEGSTILIFPKTVWEYGRRDGETPAYIGLSGDTNQLDKKVFQAFVEICGFLKESGVRLHHNSKIREILNPKSCFDSHYDNYASLLLHQL